MLLVTEEHHERRTELRERSRSSVLLFLARRRASVVRVEFRQECGHGAVRNALGTYPRTSLLYQQGRSHDSSIRRR